MCIYIPLAVAPSKAAVRRNNLKIGDNISEKI